MSEDLHEAMLGMMGAFCSSIVTLNTTSDELVKSANLIEEQLLSEALRALVRQQRVRVLEMQGQLAALTERYAAQFDREP